MDSVWATRPRDPVQRPDEAPDGRKPAFRADGRMVESIRRADRDSRQLITLRSTDLFETPTLRPALVGALRLHAGVRLVDRFVADHYEKE